MKEIQLTQGQVALIDDEDFEKVSNHSWHAEHSKHRDVFTARARIRRRLVSMHSLVLPTVNGYTVDHINRDTLDNRKCNLRIANPSQQQLNRGLYRNASTPYKGVSLNRSREAYVVGYGSAEGRVHVGTFDSPTDAAIAYDKAVLEYWSQVPDDPISGNYIQFLYLNFPEG